MLIPSFYPLVGGAEKQLEKLSIVLKKIILGHLL